MHNFYFVSFFSENWWEILPPKLQMFCGMLVNFGKVRLGQRIKYYQWPTSVLAFSLSEMVFPLSQNLYFSSNKIRSSLEIPPKALNVLWHWKSKNGPAHQILPVANISLGFLLVRRCVSSMGKVYKNKSKTLQLLSLYVNLVVFLQ